jgi:hypothetical protein
MRMIRIWEHEVLFRCEAKDYAAYVSVIVF